MDKLNNIDFAAFVRRMVGQPYWYGTVLYRCTDSLLARKSKQYPGHYTSSRMACYRDDIAHKRVAADCVGGMKGYAWTGGGQGVLESIGTGSAYASVYQANGCPDKSANGMFEYARKSGCAWGTIDTLPEVPGIAVRYDGHVGYYLGGGEVGEWRGFAYGCVITKLKGRKWTHWYQIPFLDYGAAGFDAPSAGREYALGERLLKRGMSGEDVQRLQELLSEMEFSPGAADGVFGAQTEAAVKALQKYGGLTVDGIYGPKTHAELMALIAEAADEEDDTPAEIGHIRVSAAGRWNIRKGPGTDYGILTVVSQGTALAHISTAANGWLCVETAGGPGWISPKALEVG